MHGLLTAIDVLQMRTPAEMMPFSENGERTRMTVAQFLVALIAIFAAAKLFGELAERIGQPAVLGEMIGGIVVGVSGTERREDIEHEVHDVARFFIPIFFVMVGTAVDLKQLNPFDPATRQFLVIGALLTMVAILGKLVAGYAAFGRPLEEMSTVAELVTETMSDKGD